MEGWAAQKGSMSELILSYSSGKRTRWSSTYCHLRLTEPVGLSEKDKEEPLNDGPFVEPFRWVTAIASFVLCYGVLEVLARFAILGLPVLFCLLDELVHRVWTERVHVDQSIISESMCGPCIRSYDVMMLHQVVVPSGFLLVAAVGVQLLDNVRIGPSPIVVVRESFP